MTFWTMLCLNRLVIQLIVGHIFLILLPGSILKSGFHNFHYFTIVRTMFLLMRLSIMAVLTSLWFRASNNLPFSCPSLQPLREVKRLDIKLGSSLMFNNSQYQILEVGPWQKTLHSYMHKLIHSCMHVYIHSYILTDIHVFLYIYKYIFTSNMHTYMHS